MSFCPLGPDSESPRVDSTVDTTPAFILCSHLPIDLSLTHSQGTIHSIRLPKDQVWFFFQRTSGVEAGIDCFTATCSAMTGHGQLTRFSFPGYTLLFDFFDGVACPYNGFLFNLGFITIYLSGQQNIHTSGASRIRLDFVFSLPGTEIWWFRARLIRLLEHPFRLVSGYLVAMSRLQVPMIHSLRLACLWCLTWSPLSLLAPLI